MTRNIILALVLAAPAFAATAAYAATEQFQATLKGSSEVPPTGSPGTGTLTASLDTISMKLDYTLTWSGLTGPATMAHFHGPAAAGTNAGVQVVIGGKKMPGMSMGPTSPVHAQATLTADQMAQLEHGDWYVNVHSAKFPKGEIRGQVTKE
jgi:hypothetical protein